MVELPLLAAFRNIQGTTFTVTSFETDVCEEFAHVTSTRYVVVTEAISDCTVLFVPKFTKPEPVSFFHWYEIPVATVEPDRERLMLVPPHTEVAEADTVPA